MNIRTLLRQPRLTLAFHEHEVRWTVGSAASVRAPGTVALPPGLVSDGVVRDPVALGEILRGYDAFPGRGRMQVVIALPAHRSIFRTLTVPSVKGAAFDEFAMREIRREMPMLGEHAHVAWVRNADRDGSVEIFVVGIARDVLDSHIAAVRAAGLQPISADLRVVAAARAIGREDCVLAHVEESELEIAIVRDRLPAIVRVVSLNAIPGGEEWSRQLVEEMARTIKFYRDSHRDDHDFDALPISIVGGASSQVRVASELRAATDHGLLLPDIVAPQLPAEQRLRFAANIGLAEKDLAA